MKKWLLIFCLAAVGIILNVLVNFINKEESPKIKISMEGSIFKEIQFIQKKNENIKFELFSQEAMMSDDGKVINLRNLMMFFPEKEFTVKAKSGFYYLESGDILLRDEIEGVSKNYKIYGTEAYWDAKNRTLHSEKPLKLVGNKLTIEGNEGTASADLIELKRGVRAIVYSKK